MIVKVLQRTDTGYIEQFEVVATLHLNPNELPRGGDKMRIVSKEGSETLTVSYVQWYYRDSCMISAEIVCNVLMPLDEEG